MSGRRGKSPGIKNFTPAEDVWIATAYAKVTSDASVGTDQDSDVYYKRIGDVFNKNIKDKPDFVQERSWESIRHRWLNVAQKSLLKFAGCLNKTLSEYHSGWAMDDYVTVSIVRIYDLMQSERNRIKMQFIPRSGSPGSRMPYGFRGS